jgi:hypothetical protein
VRDNLNALNDVGLTVGTGITAQTGSGGSDMTYDAASITLSTNGRYLIYSGVAALNSTVEAMSLGIWNQTTGAVVANSVGTILVTESGHFGGTYPINLFSRPVLVTVSGSTVFRPRVQRAGSSTITVPAIYAGFSSSPVSGWIAALLIGY